MAEVHHPFDCSDLETAELILSLQLEDVQDFRNCAKDKTNGDKLNDSQLALSLLEQNLEVIRSIVSDRAMTQSMAAAIHADGSLIADVVREEELACEDSTLAQRLDGCNVTSEVSLQPNLNEKILSDLRANICLRTSVENFANPSSPRRVMIQISNVEPRALLAQHEKVRWTVAIFYVLPVMKPRDTSTLSRRIADMGTASHAYKNCLTFLPRMNRSFPHAVAVSHSI